MANVNEIFSCEVCHNDQLISVLNLGRQPLCDDLIPIGNPSICEEYPIEILFCEKCCTAHQRFQVSKEELFPISYHYRSRFTQDVLDGMVSLVETCEKHLINLDKKTVLDIGCNDGSLLNFFKNKNCNTIGIEPTSACLDASEMGHTVYNAYFSTEIAQTILKKHGHPDIITFTNVFAHIENLEGILIALKILLGSDTILVIENHYLGSILEKNQFDTFYHEHPRSYSYRSFQYIARLLDMTLFDVEFPSRYGGNIRIFMCNASHVLAKKELKQSNVICRENNFLTEFDGLNNKIAIWKNKKIAEIDHYVAVHGRLQAKAFPGRSAILVKLLNLNEKNIYAVYEKPISLKINNYVPGTRIPIIADTELFQSSNKSKPLLNFAWHIPNEIRDYMKQNGYLGDIIDIVNPEDFLMHNTQLA